MGSDRVDSKPERKEKREGICGHTLPMKSTNQWPGMLARIENRSAWMLSGSRSPKSLPGRIASRKQGLHESSAQTPAGVVFFDFLLPRIPNLPFRIGHSRPRAHPSYLAALPPIRRLDSPSSRRLTLTGLPIYVARSPAAPFPARPVRLPTFDLLIPLIARRILTP